MAEALFYYYTPDNPNIGHYTFGLRMHAFIFLVANADFTISRADLVLERFDDTKIVGNFTCQIQTVNQSTLAPTGITLTYKTLNLNSLSETRTWITFNFENEADLEANTYYALVFHDTEYNNESVDYSVLWQCREFNPYSTGVFRFSADAGITWVDGSEWGWDDHDFAFRIYGDWTEEQKDNWIGILHPPLPTGVTLSDEDGVPPDIPPGTPVGTESATGENNIITVRHLLAAANNRIWLEDI